MTTKRQPTDLPTVASVCPICDSVAHGDDGCCGYHPTNMLTRVLLPITGEHFDPSDLTPAELVALLEAEHAAAAEAAVDDAFDKWCREPVDGNVLRGATRTGNVIRWASGQPSPAAARGALHSLREDLRADGVALDPRAEYTPTGGTMRPAPMPGPCADGCGALAGGDCTCGEALELRAVTAADDPLRAHLLEHCPPPGDGDARGHLTGDDGWRCGDCGAWPDADGGWRCGDCDAWHDGDVDFCPCDGGPRCPGCGAKSHEPGDPCSFAPPPPDPATPCGVCGTPTDSSNACAGPRYCPSCRRYLRRDAQPYPRPGWDLGCYVFGCTCGSTTTHSAFEAGVHECAACGAEIPPLIFPDPPDEVAASDDDGGAP